MGTSSSTPVPALPPSQVSFSHCSSEITSRSGPVEKSSIYLAFIAQLTGWFCEERKQWHKIIILLFHQVRCNSVLKGSILRSLSDLPTIFSLFLPLSNIKKEKREEKPNVSTPILVTVPESTDRKGGSFY